MSTADLTRKPAPNSAGRTYKLGERIGIGNTGSVYRATMNGRTVAVKVLHEALEQDARYRERFVREAQAMRRVRHPNIVGLLDSGADEDQLYMIMEYVEGVGLDQLVPPGGIPLERAVRLMSQILDGVGAAHSVGVIHRDLKPHNVVVVRRNVDKAIAEKAKILDFGLAKLHTASDAGAKTMDLVSGTPEFMSPEQCQAKPIDTRTDIYSCGCLFYFMLTGEPPFRADSFVAVVLKQVSEAATVPSSRVPSLSHEVDAICLKAMAKSVDDRYSSAAEFRQALERLVGMPLMGVRSSAPPPLSPAIQQLKRPDTRESGMRLSAQSPSAASSAATAPSSKPPPIVDRAASSTLAPDATSGLAVPIVGLETHLDAPEPAPFSSVQEAPLDGAQFDETQLEAAPPGRTHAGIAGNISAPPQRKRRALIWPFALATIALSLAVFAYRQIRTPDETASLSTTIDATDLGNAQGIANRSGTNQIASKTLPGRESQHRKDPSKTLPIDVDNEEERAARPSTRDRSRRTASRKARKRRWSRAREETEIFSGSPTDQHSNSDPKRVASTTTMLPSPESTRPLPTPEPAPTPTANEKPKASAKPKRPATSRASTKAPSRAPILRARATLGSVRVQGTASKTALRAALSSTLPRLEACYRTAAQRSRKDGFGSVQVSFRVDETGGVRRVRTRGARLPGLNACVAQKFNRIVVRPAPLGMATASVVVRYQSPGR